jgi:hypothetical protein
MAVAGVVAAVSSAHAQQMIPGTITSIRTGWNADSFGIVITAPQQNPAGCQNGAVGVGYVTAGNYPGYNTYYAIALAAYFANKAVTVVVHNSECVGPFPKLIGINVP